MSAPRSLYLYVRSKGVVHVHVYFSVKAFLAKVENFVLFSFIVNMIYLLHNIQLCYPLHAAPPSPLCSDLYYTFRGWDLYCSPCRLYGPTYKSSPHIPLEEVMSQAGD